MLNTNNNMQTQTSNTLHNGIMEAGSKDRPPMLAHGNYVQWKSRIKRYIDNKPNHELIHYCLTNPPYELDDVIVLLDLISFESDGVKWQEKRVNKLKCEIDENKNRNKFLETSNKVLIEKLKGELEDFKNKNKSLESSNNQFKEANNKLSETNNLLYNDYKKSEAELARRNSREYASQMEIECAKKKAQIKLYKTREDKELDKVIELEQKVKVLDNIVYKTGQSVQTMNMLNNKCRTSFAKPEFLKKAQNMLGLTMVPRNFHNKDTVVGENHQIGHNRESKNHNSG
nr:hypothetical protein [Tanacetum cinerariifolium]